MNIRGKIYSIVALMALTALAIGAIGLYTLTVYDERVASLENAAARAKNGEQLNRLVTAVVMDMRGTYGALSVDEASPFAKGALVSLAKMNTLLNKWELLVPTEQLKDFAEMKDGARSFTAFRTETARLAVEDSPRAANAHGNTDENRENRKSFQTEIDDIVAQDEATLDHISSNLQSFQSSVLYITIAVTALGILTGGGFAFYVATYQVTLPILGVTSTMKTISSGNYEASVPYLCRTDEIGEMATAVQVFKQNGLEVARMNRQDAVMRERSQDLQAGMAIVVSSAAEGDFSKRISKDYKDENLNSFASNVNALLSSVEAGVAETNRVIRLLAEGDLTHTMKGDFKGVFAELQSNVNETTARLQTTISNIRIASDSLNADSSELRSSSDNLSKRTEQQAAALEESSAALDEITAAVRNSTVRAQEASRMVSQAKERADQSGKVVAKAIDAMADIQQASQEITQIINVIDEIAFQTNLLALNAGVEAARAGDAGKGFAVVAQEVRELAQRSAAAAKDIKSLIGKSAERVQSGVKLVRETGSSLSEIEHYVVQINDGIHSIATASQQQSIGLQEVNTAVNQMDQMTQQNAAMVEETSAATHKLSGEADNLASLVAQFKLRQASVRAVTPGDRRSNVSPVHKMTARLAQSVGATALKNDTWQEF